MPTTKQQVLSFLGLANFFCFWVPAFATLANPSLKVQGFSVRATPLHSLFSKLKEAPSSFFLSQLLIVQTISQDNAVGVLGHRKGPSFQAVACLSKQKHGKWLPSRSSGSCLSSQVNTTGRNVHFRTIDHSPLTPSPKGLISHKHSMPS